MTVYLASAFAVGFMIGAGIGSIAMTWFTAVKISDLQDVVDERQTEAWDRRLGACMVPCGEPRCNRGCSFAYDAGVRS